MNSKPVNLNIDDIEWCDGPPCDCIIPPSPDLTPEEIKANTEARLKAIMEMVTKAEDDEE